MSVRRHQAAYAFGRLVPYVRAFAGFQPPASRFVILAGPRTGSELLVTLLDSHPAIACDSELFTEPRLFPRYFVTGTAARHRRTNAYGFKLIDQQLRFQLTRAGTNGEFLERLVENHGFHVVYLSRRDRLARALSFLHAADTQYHFRSGDATTFEPMTVDPAALISFLHVLEDNDRWAASVLDQVPYIPLVYEDDLLAPEDQQRTGAKLCVELGVAAAPMQSDLRAPAPSDAWSRVANPDEVAATLRTTRFTALADDLESPRATGQD